MLTAGWQHEAALPAILAGLDAVVNPSLRAWSETFCIVNIEVMAMRIPLVTFAVGGEVVAVPVVIHRGSFEGLYLLMRVFRSWGVCQ